MDNNDTLLITISISKKVDISRLSQLNEVLRTMKERIQGLYKGGVEVLITVVEDVQINIENQKDHRIYRIEAMTDEDLKRLIDAIEMKL